MQQLTIFQLTYRVARSLCGSEASCYFACGSGCELLWWLRLCVCVCVCVCVRACLCVSVCLSVHEDISGTTRAIFTIFVHVAYGRGSVLLRQGDEIPRGRSSFGGFLPHWQFIVQYSILDPYKNGWTDQNTVWDDEWAWPEEQCITVREVTICEGEGAI